MDMVKKIKCLGFLTLALMPCVYAFGQQESSNDLMVKHKLMERKQVQYSPTYNKRVLSSKHQVKQSQVNKVLGKTNIVILLAHKALVENNVHTQNFAKSVAHQRCAKKLISSDVHRALQHSRLSRLYAFEVLRSNNTSLKQQWQFTREEMEIVGKPIAADDLEKDVNQLYPEIILDDKDVLQEDLSEFEVLFSDSSVTRN